ncbi:hypothetical protein AgCh_001146 [Apium graveolens]
MNKEYIGHMEAGAQVSPCRVETYNTIIHGLLHMGRHGEARNFFTWVLLVKYRSVEKTGCKPDTITYNTIIDSLCKDRHVDHALDVHTYSILVDAYCKNGMTDDANHVVNTMIQNGVFPNVVTYNTLMDGYCLTGRMDRALEVLNTMRTGIAPTDYSFNILINGYCKRQKVDKAIDLLRQMPAEGLKPDVETYNSIIHGLFQIDGLCKNQQIDEAISLFGLMESNGIIHDIKIYNILIDGLFKNRKLDKARNIFDNLASRVMILSGFAGLVTGPCSMAIGEFVSVYSLLDVEILAVTNKLFFALFSFLLENIYYNFMDSGYGIKNSTERDVPHKKLWQVSKQMDSEYSQRSTWLQAAALGPNDGLVSATSLMMGAGFLRREVKKIKRN